MRFCLVLLSSLLVASTCLAQITITSSDVQGWYAPGKSWRSVDAQNLTLTINVGTASSTAQSWTIPTVTYTDTMRMDNLLPSATPYASRFPRATHAQRWSYSMSPTSFSTVYAYYRVTADSMIMVGNASRVQEPGVDTTYFDFTVELQALLPATLGRTVTRRDSISIGPGSYIIQRTVESYDAHGTLVVPAGSFQTLRLKTVSTSESVFGGILMGRDTSTSYAWLTREGYMISLGTTDKNPGSGSVGINHISYTAIINTPTGVVTQSNELPQTTQLHQNYPNPFNPSTNIQFDLKAPTFVSLNVYDALGREVANLVSGVRSAGTHVVRWSAHDLPSGVYLYRLSAGEYQETRRLVLMR